MYWIGLAGSIFTVTQALALDSFDCKEILAATPQSITFRTSLDTGNLEFTAAKALMGKPSSGFWSMIRNEDPQALTAMAQAYLDLCSPPENIDEDRMLAKISRAASKLSVKGRQILLNSWVSQITDPDLITAGLALRAIGGVFKGEVSGLLPKIVETGLLSADPTERKPYSTPPDRTLLKSAIAAFKAIGLKSASHSDPDKNEVFTAVLLARTHWDPEKPKSLRNSVAAELIAELALHFEAGADYVLRHSLRVLYTQSSYVTPASLSVIRALIALEGPDSSYLRRLWGFLPLSEPTNLEVDKENIHRARVEAFLFSRQTLIDREGETGVSSKAAVESVARINLKIESQAPEDVRLRRDVILALQEQTFPEHDAFRLSAYRAYFLRFLHEKDSSEEIRAFAKAALSPSG